MVDESEKIVGFTATAPASGGDQSGLIFGVSADVYERRSEYVLMTKDDFETFEARMQDEGLFRNLSILFLSGGIPLGIEKLVDWYGGAKGGTVGILLICAFATVLGVIFGLISHSRRSRTSTFKSRLFHSERLVASNVTMFPMQTRTSVNS